MIQNRHKEILSHDGQFYPLDHYFVFDQALVGAKEFPDFNSAETHRLQIHDYTKTVTLDELAQQPT